MEAFIPPKHPSSAGSCYLHRPMLLPHSHQVDAQRERDAVRKKQPRDEPFTTGQIYYCFPIDFPLFITADPQLFQIASGVAHLHDLGIVHGDLKGVSLLRIYNPGTSCLIDPSRQTSSLTTTVTLASQTLVS